METLETFDFNKRPSRSQYAPVLKALIEDGATAVRLTRGVDFPDKVSIESVQSAVSDQIRKTGKRARTYRESNDTIVVGLNEKPAPTRKRAPRREPVAA